MIASDDNNPNFIGAKDPDAALSVIFYKKPLKLEYQSELEKRPIFQDVDFVKITMPGNLTSIIDTPVREEHKSRFPRQWQAYKNRVDDSAGVGVGTPISEWPRITPSQAEELRALKFYTVDAIAHASDAQLQGIGMVAGQSVFTFREDARRFLSLADATSKQAEADRLLTDAKAQIEAEREALRLEREANRAENEANQAAMREMREQMQSLMSSAGAPAKRGRKPKSETVTE